MRPYNILLIPYNFSTFSEWHNGHSYSEDELISLLHAGLYHRSLTNNKDWIPFLAEEMPTISDDNLTWTIKLREDLKFPNGNSLTAEDVEFTYRVALTPDINKESGSYEKMSSVLKANSSVNAIDEYTVKFSFVIVENYQFELLSHTIIDKDTYLKIDSSCLNGVIADCNWNTSDGNFTQNAGPYQIVSLSETELKVTQNPYFFNHTSLQAQEIVIKVIEDKQTALEALKNGEIDFLSEAYSLNNEDISGMSNFAIDVHPLTRTEWVLLNHLHPIFGTGENIPNGSGLSDNDQVQALWVRKAMTHVIDRDYIISEFYDGLGVPAASVIPPSALNYYPGIVPPEYSIELSKTYMENAGFDFTTITDGNSDGDYNDLGDVSFFNLTLAVPGNYKERDASGIYFAQQLAKIGINATFINGSWVGSQTPDFNTRLFDHVGELIPLYDDGGYDMMFLNFGQPDFEWKDFYFYTSDALCDSDFSVSINQCAGNLLN